MTESNSKTSIKPVHNHSTIISQPKLIGKGQKVKIYYLTRLETWADIGVGSLYQVEEFNPQTEENEEYILVQSSTIEEIGEIKDIDEDELQLMNRDLSQKVILRFRFHPDNYYEKQNDSIVICKEKITALEFAISFSDSESASEFWEFIKSSNANNLHEDIQQKKPEIFEDLPLPSISKLEDTLDAFEPFHSMPSSQCKMSSRSPQFSFINIKKEYLDKLFDIFDELEEKGEMEKLETFYQIIRKLMVSNDLDVISILMSHKYFFKCLGAFECKKYQLHSIVMSILNQDKKIDQKENYREKYKKDTKFLQVIEIKNVQILDKIHMNYRLQYFKDTVMTSYVEDSSTVSINEKITLNNLDILEYIKEKQFMVDLNEHFFDDLSNSIKFVGELITIISNPQLLAIRPSVVRVMNKYGFLKIFFDSLQIVCEKEQNKDLRTRQTLKLMEAITILAQEPKELVGLIFGKGCNSISASNCNKYLNTLKQLFNAPINASQQQQSQEVSSIKSSNYLMQLSQLLIHEDAGVQIQVVEVLKSAFDFMSNCVVEDSLITMILCDFFGPCFEHYLKMEISNQFVSFVLQFLELFILAYKLSISKLRLYIIKQQLIIYLFKGADSKDKAIHLALIRLLRQLIVNDPLIINHLINANIIDKTWQIYLKHDRRHNLVNSTFQDMLYFLLVQNTQESPKLFKYIMKQFGDQIRTRQEKNLCFKKIIAIYEEKKSLIDSQEILGLDNSGEYPYDSHQGMEEIEEEKYFDSDDKQDLQQQEQKENIMEDCQAEKQNIANKQQIKENIKKKFGLLKQKQEPDEDFFSQFSHSNNNNNSLNDSFSSNCSLVKNFNHIKLNIDSSQNNNYTNHKKLEINIDFGEDDILMEQEILDDSGINDGSIDSNNDYNNNNDNEDQGVDNDGDDDDSQGEQKQESILMELRRQEEKDKIEMNFDLNQEEDKKQQENQLLDHEQEKQIENKDTNTNDQIQDNNNNISLAVDYPSPSVIATTTVQSVNVDQVIENPHQIDSRDTFSLNVKRSYREIENQDKEILEDKVIQEASCLQQSQEQKEGEQKQEDQEERVSDQLQKKIKVD